MKNNQKINELIDQRLNQKIGFIARIGIYILLIVLFHILYYNLILGMDDFVTWEYYVAGILATLLSFGYIFFVSFYELTRDGW